MFPKSPKIIFFPSLVHCAGQMIKTPNLHWTTRLGARVLWWPVCMFARIPLAQIKVRASLRLPSTSIPLPNKNFPLLNSLRSPKSNSHPHTSSFGPHTLARIHVKKIHLVSIEPLTLFSLIRVTRRLCFVWSSCREIVMMLKIDL